MSSTEATERDRDRDARTRLASTIDSRREEIEQRWLARIPTSVKGRPLDSSELRNSMPEYLVRLAEGLRGSASVEAGGSSSWENVAKEHAETRVRLGFDIDQLVDEFIILRRVLFDVIEEEHGSMFSIRDTATLADLIDGAIEAAVTSYVHSRDSELRRQQAEHIGFLTHELRNPLNTAMLGMARLRRTLSLSPEHVRTFDMIERNQRRIAELIDGVLLLERDQHALEPRQTVSTLRELLGEPIATATVAAESKRLRFDSRFDPDLAVYADPALAASAVDNVLQNAIKYTDEGYVELAAEDGATDIVIHVRDSGPGISAEDLQRIFEPFHRGDSRKPGSGLGLAIARRALEVQGGTIQAEAGREEGCHFWLTLPKPRQ